MTTVLLAALLAFFIAGYFWWLANNQKVEGKKNVDLTETAVFVMIVVAWLFDWVASSRRRLLGFRRVVVAVVTLVS